MTNGDTAADKRPPDGKVESERRSGLPESTLPALRNECLLSLIDLLPEPIFGVDGNGRVLVWNRALESLTGVRREEMIGQGDHAYALPFYGERRPCLIDLVWKDDPETESRYPVLHRKGPVVYAEGFAPVIGAYFKAKAYPIFDARGNRLGALESVQDITERKLAEAALRESEERYRLLFEHGIDAVLDLNQDGRINDANVEACRIFGRSREELVGLTLEELTDGTDTRFGFAKREFWKADRHRGEITFLRPDGTSFPGAVSLTPYWRKDGSYHVSLIVKDITSRKRAEAVLCMHRDRLAELVAERTAELTRMNKKLQAEIREHKKTERALRMTEELFRSAFQNAGAGMALVAPDGRWLQVNRTLCEIVGYSEAELLATDLQAVTHPADSGRDKDCVGRLFSRSARSCHFEKRFLHKWGDVVWVSLNLSLVRDLREHPLYFVVQIQDITAAKEAEEKIRNYQEQLRSLASELTLAGERERRRIAAGLHDHISQNLVLSRLKLEALRRSFAVDVQESIDEVLGLIARTIEYSRSLTFDLSPPVLYELGLEAAVEVLGERFEAQYGVSFNFRDDGQPKPVRHETRILLFMAVRELLANTAKHARAGLVSVSLVREHDTIRICVADDGRGFDPSAQTNGYGLFSIRERLESLGGNMRIESEPGKGTRVILTAPLEM